MKIEYRRAGVGGAYAVLYDESVGQVSPTYKASFADKAEQTPGFGSASAGITPNANTVATLVVPLSVPYASPDAAKAGIRALRATLKGLRVNLKVTVGADVDFWPSAVLTSMTANLTGQVVDYELTFTSQDVTNAEPA